MSDLKQAIANATTAAMKARDKQRVATMRLVNAEIKRVEVDERSDGLDDDAVIVVLNRMLKQRQDSLTQFTDAGRTDLADQERFEIEVIGEFMPEQLSADEVAAIVAKAVTDSGAESMKDMGKVMGIVKGQLQGRADMGAVSAQVKALLA
ncbi:MAG: GatB/YqeY domain-containing protein, partial [Gammaproteobacteria bacterium]|nr:GatB/YqeY domain-containing protein [Gammaproteobacteria bacterium]